MAMRKDENHKLKKQLMAKWLNDLPPLPESPHAALPQDQTRIPGLDEQDPGGVPAADEQELRGPERVDEEHVRKVERVKEEKAGGVDGVQRKDVPFFENWARKTVDTEEQEQSAGADELLQGGAEVECTCEGWREKLQCVCSCGCCLVVGQHRVCGGVDERGHFLRLLALYSRRLFLSTPEIGAPKLVGLS